MADETENGAATATAPGKPKGKKGGRPKAAKNAANGRGKAKAKGGRAKAGNRGGADGYPRPKLTRIRLTVNVATETKKSLDRLCSTRGWDHDKAIGYAIRKAILAKD